MKTKLLFILFLFVSMGLTAQEKNLNQLMQERNEYYFTFELNGNDDLPLIAKTVSVDRVDGNVVTAYANNKEFAEFQKLAVARKCAKFDDFAHIRMVGCESIHHVLVCAVCRVSIPVVFSAVAAVPHLGFKHH